VEYVNSLKDFIEKKSNKRYLKSTVKLILSVDTLSLFLSVLLNISVTVLVQKFWLPSANTKPTRRDT
jgi:hypothetical protein